MTRAWTHAWTRTRLAWLPRVLGRYARGGKGPVRRGGEEGATGPRTFAIGDIHGEITLLRKLIETLAPQESDRLVFLGDYIDRGEDSRAVIDYCLKLRECCECVFLKGNHEDMLLDYLENNARRYGPVAYLYNGGTATLASYGAADALELARRMPPAHLDFLHSLPERWEDDHYIYVHAGLPEAEGGSDASRAHLWVREKFIYSKTAVRKKVIFGHTPQREPLVMADKIGVDTGAFYRGVLTALELPAEVFHQVRR